ncbi:uncharacterized protein UDID_17462 [Ustilago sp. UG-2017a]|nr:uncharacterized protein UDID_17462 [Ustilago sp. UG-2017a]
MTCFRVSLTQFFFLRLATVLQVFILWPLSGNQLHAPELGPSLAALGPSHIICHMVSSTTDLGEICDINFAHADLGEICNRAVSTTDLSELCCKSYDLPDSLIPALPSYELTDLPASCASSPMTQYSHILGRE